MQRLIEEIKACRDQQYGFAALALVLIIPNACATFSKGAHATGQDYIDWCNRWVQYHDNLDGEVIYAMRCAFLHAMDADLNEQPVFNKYLKKKVSLGETRTLSYRLYFPHPDASEAVIYKEENNDKISRTLCTGLLVSAILDAYEDFAANTPEFSHKYTNIWFEG